MACAVAASFLHRRRILDEELFDSVVSTTVATVSGDVAGGATVAKDALAAPHIPPGNLST